MRYVPEADRRSAPGWDARRERRPGNEENRVPAVAEEQLRDVELAAGEMSLHDVFVLHGSGPNHGGEKRVGFAIRFTTPECRPANGRPAAILARGEDRFGHFELAAPPRDEADPAALAQMRQSARRHLDATLQNLKRTAH
jgi:hypothetical protein